MKIGFVGTGSIAEALIHGLCTCENPPELIVVSPRNAERAQRLASLYDILRVAGGNQDVLDHGDWIFLTVTPDIAEEVLRSLRFRPGHKMISCVSTLTFAAAKDLINSDARIFKAMPLPPVAEGLGPIAYGPQDDGLEALFNRIGTAVAAKDEAAFRALTAVTAQVAAYHALQAKLGDWLVRQEVEDEKARAYVGALFQALSTQSAADDAGSLEKRIHDVSTAGGLNDQVLSFLQDEGWYGLTHASLDDILKRLNEA